MSNGRNLWGAFVLLLEVNVNGDPSFLGELKRIRYEVNHDLSEPSIVK